MERLNIKKLNNVEYKEQYRVEASDRFAALKDLDAEADIDSTSLLERIYKFQPQKV
jgi:hypothetical protein